MSQTVAELLVDTLAQVGVRQIFGIVGDALNPFTDAIRRDGRIEWIGVRHEEGAALAAAGQAKFTGQLAVCCGTTGPGANHLVAGLYEARKDHAPVLAISGGVPSERRGTDYLQEDDPVALFRDVSVYSQLIAAAGQAPGTIQQAIAVAYAAPGVAHLSIPPDVFRLAAPKPVPSVATLRRRPEVAPSAGDVAEAARLIGEAGSVAIFCGHGARGAQAELVALAERLAAPLLHTYRAKDLLPHDHPRWMGGVGLIGGRPGVDAVREADLLLMLGTDYPYSEFLPQKGSTVIQVDERAEAIGRRAPVTLGIVGSVAPAVRQLLEAVSPRTDPAFCDGVRRAREEWDAMLDGKAALDRVGARIHPQVLARLLSDHADDDAVFVTDTGEVTLWAANWHRQRGTQRISGSFNNAAVGTGLGIANGIQALDRRRQVLLHVGDGGFAMLLGEFLTAVEHELPVKVVVYDNGGWGLVHLEMEGAGLPANGGTRLQNADYGALAIACGAEGFTAMQSETLAGTVRAFLAAPGPAVLHVLVDPDELPTMPHVELGQAVRFGIAKVREGLAALRHG